MLNTGSKEKPKKDHCHFSFLYTPSPQKIKEWNEALPFINIPEPLPVRKCNKKMNQITKRYMELKKTGFFNLHRKK